MPEKDQFIPLDQIGEMSEAEKTWLKEKCSINQGYYDATQDRFVVKKVKG